MTTGLMSSRHGGGGLRLVVGLATLFAFLALVWMLLLPRVVTRLVRDRTGFDVRMRSFYFNPFTARLKVDGLTITNPSGYPRKDFLNIPELRIHARPGSLFSRTWKIDDAVVHLAAVTLVRDAQDGVNARRFGEGWSKPAASSPAGEGEAQSEHTFRIGRLALQVDRVVIADYSGGRPLVRTFDVHFKRTYANVSGMQGLATVVAAVMARTGEAGQRILPQAGSFLHAAARQLQEAGRKTGAMVKGLFESLEKKL